MTNFLISVTTDNRSHSHRILLDINTLFDRVHRKSYLHAFGLAPDE